VVADLAEAELMFRTVGDPARTREAVLAAAAGRAERGRFFTRRRCNWRSSMDCRQRWWRLRTDIPSFGGTWGQPFLIGPGSIHIAHTAEEHIPKRELLAAVDIYARMAAQLLATGGSGA